MGVICLAITLLETLASVVLLTIADPHGFWTGGFLDLVILLLGGSLQASVLELLMLLNRANKMPESNTSRSLFLNYNI